MSMADLRGILGIEGRIRIVQHDVRTLRGSGPNGEVVFEDLWAVGPDGKLQMKQPRCTVEDRTVRNKFTKRGLSYLLRTLLKSHSGTDQSKQPTDITYGWSNNPFQAFVLIGDDGPTPTRRGDARVLWNESDGQYDDKIPAGSGVAVYGRRGLLLSLTTGIFKRVQIRYPNASPNYEELEYTFFAQANTVKQDGPTGGDVGIDDFVVKSVALAYGVACGYNEASSQVGTRAVLGVPAIHQGVCDRLYKHEWFTYGDGSAEGQGGVPATIHNGAAGVKYSTGEAIDGDGYVASSEATATTIGSITGSGTDTFTASTKRIKLTNAPTDMAPGFTSAHIRKTVTITGSTSNNKDFTIKRVVSSSEIEVFETVVDESGATAAGVVKTTYTGLNAFDGRVENEGLTSKDTYDADPPATIIQGDKWASSDVAGPHYVGRVWYADRKIAGVRIVFPKGSVRDFCPNRLQIQTLDVGQNPEGGTWTTRLDYSGTDQASNIFDNGEYGYEYMFASPVTTKGVRVYVNSSADASRKTEIGELYIFEVRDGDAGREWLSTDGTKVLKHAVDDVPTWRTSVIPAVSDTANAQTMVDAINRRLIGWGLEAYRSTFGFIWIRATVAGSYATCRIEQNSQSTFNTDIGLNYTSTSQTQTGITQPFVKNQMNAVTFIYTLRMAGNFSKPFDF